MDVGAVVFVDGKGKGFTFWPAKIDHIESEKDIRVLYLGENTFDTVSKKELKLYSEELCEKISKTANAKLRKALRLVKEEAGGLPAAAAERKKPKKKRVKREEEGDDEDEDAFEVEDDADADDDDDDEDWDGGGKRKRKPQKKTKKEKAPTKTKAKSKAKKPSNKGKKPEVTEDAGTEDTPKEACEGDCSEIGHRVIIKGPDGRWRKGTVVQLNRAGVTQKYKVLGVKVLYDSNRTQLHPIPSKEVLSLGCKKEIRYWSSGTPCMRLGDSVDQFARDTKKKAADRIALRLSQTKKPSVAKFTADSTVIAGISKAEQLSIKILKGLKKGQAPSSVQALEALAAMGANWPTQKRDNVTPDGKEVPGMCFGLVHVLGGKGMQVSSVAQTFPNLTKVLVRWTAATIPDADGYPFSSLQVNYNYKARKHTDSNNLGPSYICSIGEHCGGELWTGDKYIVEHKDGKVSYTGGGGPAQLDCKHGNWMLFNGCAEHETQPFSATKKGEKNRISFIAFSHQRYNQVAPYVASELEELGFTAGSSDMVDLPFFDRFRLDKVEFDEDENTRYFKYQIKRATEMPPPVGECKVALECYGLTMARGGGWMSFCSSKNDETPTVIELKPNMTGFHAIELKVVEKGGAVGRQLELVSKHTDKHRFNLYKDTASETNRFSKWVDGLPSGHVVMICITDTAIAAKRPPTQQLYDALAKLGGSSTMERVMYRCPFAMIGWKGAKQGEAQVTSTPRHHHHHLLATTTTPPLTTTTPPLTTTPLLTTSTIYQHHHHHHLPPPLPPPLTTTTTTTTYVSLSSEIPYTPFLSPRALSPNPPLLTSFPAAPDGEDQSACAS
jgi:hypothetical protein